MLISKLLSICDGLHIPATYGAFREPQVPPFVCILGDGEDTFKADNEIYHRNPQYTMEYYFTEKAEEREFEFEDALVRNGFIYVKSEDIFIEAENVYEIQYTVWRSITNGRSE